MRHYSGEIVEPFAKLFIEERKLDVQTLSAISSGVLAPTMPLSIDERPSSLSKVEPTVLT